MVENSQSWRCRHAPVAGFGDGEDYAHRGFACFRNLIEKYKPKYLVHGHIHMTYGTDIPREQQLGDTKIINAYERYSIEILKNPNSLQAVRIFVYLR